MGRKRVDNAALVTREVDRLLEAVPAYHSLPVQDQRTVAGNMVRIGLYLAAPQGMPANGLTGALTAVPAKTARRDLLASVNFPNFVAGLIHGVFQAIVDASTEQMRAYGELLGNVAKTLAQFETTEISDEVARAWLVSTYAGCVALDPESGALRLDFAGDCLKLLSRLSLLLDEASLREIPGDKVEEILVPAVRRKLAANRQRTLATMVLMGINRIVVTDSTIATGRPL